MSEKVAKVNCYIDKARPILEYYALDEKWYKCESLPTHYDMPTLKTIATNDVHEHGYTVHEFKII